MLTKYKVINVIYKKLHRVLEKKGHKWSATLLFPVKYNFIKSATFYNYNKIKNLTNLFRDFIEVFFITIKHFKSEQGSLVVGQLE